LIRKKKNKAILGKPHKIVLISKVYNHEILDTSLIKKIKYKSFILWIETMKW
jgi:hypothetical protein